MASDLLLSIMVKPPWRGMSTFSDEQSAQGKVYVIGLDPVGSGVQVIHYRFDEDRGDASEVLARATLIQILGLEAGVVPTHQHCRHIR
jgi:hypothetical protein